MFKLELRLLKYLDDFKLKCLNSWENYCKRSTEHLKDYELDTLYYKYLPNRHIEDVLLFLLLQSWCIMLGFILLAAFFSNITGIEFWVHLGMLTWVVFLIIRIVLYVRSRIIQTAINLRHRRTKLFDI